MLKSSEVVKIFQEGMIPLRTGSKRKKVPGAVFVETLIAMNLLIIIIVGMVDIGTLLFQIILASEAIHVAERSVSITAGITLGGAKCSQLSSRATTEANNFIQNTLRKVPNQFWQLTTYSDFGQGVHFCEMIPPDKVTPDANVKDKMTMMQMEATILAQQTCLMCNIPAFQSILPHIKRTMVIPYTCCNDEAGSAGCNTALPNC